MNARLKRLVDWRLWLVYTHRWLGIAGCVLFVAWFVSGVVMMYARMPTLASEERLARAAPLDLSTATVTPSEAAEQVGASVSDVGVAMYGDRPVYRFDGGRNRGSGLFVFSDNGEIFSGITREQALPIAKRFEPQYAGEWRYDGYLEEPDQWTLQAGAMMPMHRFALADEAGTRIYVSEVTGDVALRTTSRERFWGYLGPVVHWVYFTPLRQNGRAWSEFIIWSSLIGCVMCVTGLVWGLVRFSPYARFRLKRVPAHSPYAGFMKWHHYAGLLFGVITLTWTYSGLLSMGPFNWFEPVGGRGAGPRRNARPERPAALDTLSLDQLRDAHRTFSRQFVPKSMELVEFQGEMFWVAERAPESSEADRWRSPSLMPRGSRPSLERHYVSVSRPEHGTFTSFPKEAMADVARRAMPGVAVKDAVWLTAYDSYYYDPRSSRPLPVLRVRYEDPQETWLYVDPSRGAVVQRNEKVTRLRRWLYQGLHSLDFPFLYYKRPLWDIVVIALSIGGTVLSATTLVPAWRRLKRQASAKGAYGIIRTYESIGRRWRGSVRVGADGAHIRTSAGRHK
jgi:hypothetical protein